MAEFDDGPVFKVQGAVRGVVRPGLRRHQPDNLFDMIRLELRIRPPDDQDPDARIADRTADGLDADGVRLAAAARPAVRRVKRPAPAEQDLLRRQLSRSTATSGDPPLCAFPFRCTAIDHLKKRAGVRVYRTVRLRLVPSAARLQRRHII
jgi:hypothetical protein